MLSTLLFEVETLWLLLTEAESGGVNETGAVAANKVGAERDCDDRLDEESCEEDSDAEADSMAESESVADDCCCCCCR